jgi:hypothetical protein
MAWMSIGKRTQETPPGSPCVSAAITAPRSNFYATRGYPNTALPLALFLLYELCVYTVCVPGFFFSYLR